MDKARKILLIEDSSDYAALVQRWLSVSHGDVSFVLKWSDSLAGGLGQLARGKTDVVVLDLNLPDSEGLGTLNAVKARAGETPIIILSATDGERMALQMIGEGAENYIDKRLAIAERCERLCALRLRNTRRKPSHETS